MRQDKKDTSVRGEEKALGFTHQLMVEIGTRWLTRQYSGIVVLPEYSRASGETPDVIGFGKRNSYLIECKISHTDFLADKRKPYRENGSGMGNYRWYLSPCVIPRDELPYGWGLLVYRNGRVFKLVNPVRFSHASIREHEYGILQSLVRRAEIRGLIPQLRLGLGESPTPPPSTESVKP